MYDGEPGVIRTRDKLIKSQLLYQLSYGPIVSDGAFLRVNDCSVKHPFKKNAKKVKLLKITQGEIYLQSDIFQGIEPNICPNYAQR